MNDTERLYTERYAQHRGGSLYAVEFVVRMLLGTYPGLTIDRTRFRGSKILVLGDSRELPGKVSAAGTGNTLCWRFTSLL